MNSPENRRELSREEELMLSRYYDGECSFVERWKVRRILSRIPYAETYLDSLNEVGKQVCVYESSVVRDDQGQSIKVDLWDRISRRIDEEERAALFLGQRPLEVERGGFFNIDFAKLAWGFSGSMVTAAVALVLIRSGNMPASVQTSPQPAAVTLRTSFAHPTQNVALAGPSAKQQMRRSIEMDWVRSDGRVEMIQDPVEQSPIIWVNRSRIPMVQLEELQDGKNQNNDRPVIIKERLPRGLTVAGPRLR